MPTHRHLTHSGETLNLKEWAARTGLTYQAIQCRLGMGWTVAEALNPERKRSIIPAAYTHDGESLTLAEWGKRTGLSAQALRARLRYGWTLAQALSTPKLRERRQ